jgi:trk system potassium uptake protein TrkA
VGDVEWPPDTVLVGIIRAGRPIAPTADDSLEGRDQLLLITVAESEGELQQLLAPPAADGARQTT